MFEKYIECPSCHFGGYEFCPECLGAGGYVIQIEENPNHNIEVKIDTNLITQINNTLNIIDRGIQECTYYKKINWKESFSYLKKALKNLKGQQSIEVLETQKHIIKLWKDLNLKKRFQEEVDIINGLTSYDIKIQLFDNQIYINDPNEVEFKKSKIIWEFFNQKPQETYIGFCFVR